MPRYLNKTLIDFCHYSWNWGTGCDKDPPCTWCYARREAAGRAAAAYLRGFVPEFHINRLEAPLQLATPSIIFADSMCDAFSKGFTYEQILRVLDVMRRAPQHKFILLTKMPQRMLAIEMRYSRAVWPENLWLGVSVPDLASCRYLSVLNALDHPNKLISFEPLLEDVVLGEQLYLASARWIIIGALTGKGAYQPEPGWVSHLGWSAKGNGDVPVFIKRNLTLKGFQKYKAFPAGFPTEGLRYCRDCGAKLRPKLIEWGSGVCNRCANKV